MFSMKISLLAGVTVLLCLTRINDVDAKMSPAVVKQTVAFYDKIIPQIPKNNPLHQLFGIGREFMTTPADEIKAEKLKQFFKSVLEPKLIVSGMKSLKPEVRKQMLDFYNEIIPQMPESCLLRMRYEQAREVLSDLNNYQEEHFDMSPEVRKQVSDFYKNIIPKLPKNTPMRQGFETGKDLLSKPYDSIDAEKFKQFLKFFVSQDNLRASVRSLSPQVKKEIVSFFDEILPKIPKMNLFRLRFEQGRKLMLSA